MTPDQFTVYCALAERMDSGELTDVDTARLDENAGLNSRIVMTLTGVSLDIDAQL
jgi:hypothetical protein